MALKKEGKVQCVLSTAAAPGATPVNQYQCSNGVDKSVTGEVAKQIMQALNVEPIVGGGGGGLFVKSTAAVDCVYTEIAAPGRQPVKSYYCNSSSIPSATTADHQAIYEALDVEAQPQAAVRTKAVLMKSVGGLSCLKEDDIRRGLKFSCAADKAVWNPKAIYSSLKVVEVGVPDVRMFRSTQKSIGGLSCLKRAHFNPKIDSGSVTCELAK